MLFDYKLSRSSSNHGICCMLSLFSRGILFCAASTAPAPISHQKAARATPALTSPCRDMATRIASARPAAFRFLRSSTSRGLSSPRAAHHRTVSASMDSAPVPAADELAFGPWMIKRSEVFKATTKTFAFVNIRPLVPGHVLVSPVRVVPRFSDLNPDEVADMWTTAHEIGKKLEPHYGASSMTYAIQDGPAAGQTVPHVHIHILPRMAGDFEKNDEVYDAIEGNEGDIKEALAEGSGARQGTQKLDLDIERKNRSAEEMAEEARTLAALFT